MNRFILILIVIVTSISITFYLLFFKKTSQVTNTTEIKQEFTQATKELIITKDSESQEFLNKIQYVGEYKIYFDAKKVGKVSSGKFKDYDRYLLITKSNSQNDNVQNDFKCGENNYILFITKDYQTFITNKNLDANSNYRPYFKEGISVIQDSIPSNLPNEIKINQNFILKSQEMDSYHYVDKECMLSNYPKNTQLKVKEGNWNKYDTLISENNATVYLNDSGLYTRYYVIPKFNSNVKYKRIGETNEAGGRVEENIQFDKPLKENYKYTNYDLPFYFDVTLSYYAQIQLNDSDVSLITKKYGVEIFEIKNKDSKIYQQLVTQEYKSRNLRNQVINDKDRQNAFNDNISKGAILFIKNPFGGYIYLLENQDTVVPLGGGKPVIYLYPEKDTKVTVKFDKQMLFSNVVPNYKNSWEVLASPNGNLKDLKPEFTKCSDIKITRSTTYAKDACEINNYPYLYWSGAVFNNIEFPKQKAGFIVKKEELSQFFDEKLKFIGFNQKEIADFKEFWVPELISKNKNYYTISFLQNEELNALFPMTVTPKPDSQIRIFMDWNGYDELPQLPKQNLVTFPRNGFTLTEWGGYLKK